MVYQGQPRFWKKGVWGFLVKLEHRGVTLRVYIYVELSGRMPRVGCILTLRTKNA